ncbi:TPA: nucleotide sugar dehydrogenase [Candidatus Poribacteria bacterium]|nr:nucleotide sugar dehydrogenase [Candidatus Poribacteria bacterium]
MNSRVTSISEKIRERTAKIAVIGLGYVGLNISISFACEGFQVYGFDVDERKIDSLRNGINYIPEEGFISEMLPRVISKSFFVSTNVDEASAIGDVIIIIVPTANGNTPTMEYLHNALNSIIKNDITGKLIVLESTVKVGTTEEIVVPALEKTGLFAGKDFFVGYSPERIDPGNKERSLRNIPKVVSGINPESAEITAKLYENIVNEVVLVSSTRTAEFIKLMENVQRDVNIALMNLFAIMCEKANIDIEEAIFAASTKWNFHPYKASCGVGGHCLKKDPLLLAHSFDGEGLDLGLIYAARKINDLMPTLTAEKALLICSDKIGKNVSETKFGILGLSYKKNSSDTRNAPAFYIIDHLKKNGAQHIYPYDPLVKNGIIQAKVSDILNSDIIILTAAHDCFSGLLDNYDGYIVDGTNTLEPSDKVIGIGRNHIDMKFKDKSFDDSVLPKILTYQKKKLASPKINHG